MKRFRPHCHKTQKDSDFCPVCHRLKSVVSELGFVLVTYSTGLLLLHWPSKLIIWRFKTGFHAELSAQVERRLYIVTNERQLTKTVNDYL